MRTILIGALSLLAACTSAARGQSHGARHVADRVVCVPAARTDGDTPAGAANGCRSLTPTSPAWDDAWNLHLCGPCNFAYDDAATIRERATGHATDCCYVGSSPPPPPVPPGGPRS